MKNIIKNIRSALCVLLCLTTFLTVISSAGLAQAFELRRTADGYSYTVTREGGSVWATITEYSGDERVLTIPSSLGGHAVKYIKSLGSASVEKIIIPSGVVGIGVDSCDGLEKGVLAECPTLTEIQLSATVEYIGDYAFYHCKNLKSVDFENATSLKKIGAAAFAKCRALNKFTAPDSLETVGISAFSGCKRLDDVTLNEGVSYIGEKAFAYCGFRSFYIPSGVAHFGDLGGRSARKTHKRSVLHGCKRLREVVVSEDNELLSSRDGILFSKDGSLLCFYPPAKQGSTYKVPKRVKEICDFAFSYTANLTSVIISKDITKTNEWTFYRCQNIDSAVFAIAPVWVGSYSINDTSLKSTKTHDGYRLENCVQTKSKREIRTGTAEAQETERRPLFDAEQKERKPDIPRKTFVKTKIVLLI